MSLINYNTWDYDIENEIKFCTICEGWGTTGSNCCGAIFYEPGWPDNDICSDCGEHAEPWDCDTCEGKGEIKLTWEEINELKDDILANEGDRLSDESRER